MNGSGNRRPTPVSDVLAAVIRQAGIEERVEQASVLPEWPELVGEQISTVTAPRSITADGTLFVAVSTHAWMSELQMLERELVGRVNERLEARGSTARVQRIRWVLRA
jgi:predicted nucleic acid-binding Zn ribbon protein